MYRQFIILLKIKNLHPVRSGSCLTTQCVEEGPYYKSCAPVVQMGGNLPQICTNSVRNDRLFMNGTVRIVDTNSPCGRPVRALLDIWHADSVGEYSNISPASSDFVSSLIAHVRQSTRRPLLLQISIIPLQGHESWIFHNWKKILFVLELPEASCDDRLGILRVFNDYAGPLRTRRGISRYPCPH